MDSVSKEAREAAADLLSGGGIAGHDRYTSEVREGLHDSTEEYVQAFARFQEATRLAVVEEAEVICVREAADAQREIDLYDSYGGPELGQRSREVVRHATAKRLLAAIRALPPKVAGQ